jgi:hypothetical protein
MNNFFGTLQYSLIFLSSVGKLDLKFGFEIPFVAQKDYGNKKIN